MFRGSLIVGIPWLAGLVVLAGCASPQQAEIVGTADQAIQGGTADPGDVSVVDVVWLDGSSVSECTGSLIAPNLVLTAHHCVSNVLNTTSTGGIDCAQTTFSKPAAAANFYVSTKQFISMNAADFHTVQEVVVPPGTGTFCGNDQALLVLSDLVLSTEAVPLVPRVDLQPKANEAYSAIGFGGTVQDGTGSGQRRRLDGLAVSCVGDTCTARYGGQLDATHEWIGDHGTCEGDSGGPAMDQQGRVIGVTSRGTSDCGSPVYGDVFAWASWIDQTAMHAAQLGGYDAPAWATGYPTDPVFNYPVGATCGDPPTCASGLCLGDAEGTYCTRLCEDDAPCPNGYTCETINQQQVCERAPQTKDETVSSGHCSLHAGERSAPSAWVVGIAAAATVAFRKRRARRARRSMR